LGKFGWGYAYGVITSVQIAHNNNIHIIQYKNLYQNWNMSENNFALADQSKTDFPKLFEFQ